jgi:signal peptidase II
MDRLSLRNFLSPIALSCFLLTAVLGYCLDQWSKVVAFEKLSGGVQLVDGIPSLLDRRSVVFIPGWLQFDVTANIGAVFGIGQGQRTLFVLVSIAAVLFIFYLFATSDRQRFYQVVLGMLLAGVLGNLYDRVQYGYVRDMIHALPDKSIFGRPAFPWIFNVADSLLCVGVGLMIIYSFFHNPEKAKSQAQTA